MHYMSSYLNISPQDAMTLNNAFPNTSDRHIFVLVNSFTVSFTDLLLFLSIYAFLVCAHVSLGLLMCFVFLNVEDAL